jgi:Rrf2 family transcriptional regulator, iron-sulfur cluster assembly transcription factor
MTVIFSKKCEYGLQAVLYLSTLDSGEMASALEISKILNIPKEFVSKILQNLTFHGIVASKKGNSGGFFLKKDASEIKLIDIVKAIDGLSLFDKCVLGFPNCSPDHPCPVHNKWGRLREEAYKMLSAETLEQFRKKTIAKIKNIYRKPRKKKINNKIEEAVTDKTQKGLLKK